MFRKLFLPLLSLAAASVFFASCSKDEGITSVEVSSVSFSNPVSSLSQGQSYMLSVKVMPLDVNEPYTLSFTSSREEVARVSTQGNISALAAGETEIKVFVREKPEISASFTLTVRPVYLAPENKTFQKVAYFPSYRTLTAEGIPDSKLKMVDVACFAFASINSDYTLTVQEPGKLSALVARCKANGVKVLISLNGTHSTYAAMTSSTASRTTFINSLKNIVNTYDLDGVDNDWEYPKTSDNSSVGNTALMRELSIWLHDPTVNKLLTMAITPGKYAGSIRDGIQDECFNYVDWFNVMVYDDFSNDTPGINHSPFALLQTAYNYWIGTRNLPRYKFVCGTPVYGRSSGLGKGIEMSYITILNNGGSPDANEAVIISPSYNGGVAFSIYYNGRPLVRQKTRFCIDQKLGGVMFWEAGQDSQDDRSLIKAAYDEVGGYSDIR